MFGFVGHKKSSDYVLIDDEFSNPKEYEEVPLNIDMFHLQEIIRNTNAYISKKIDDCTYIIETSDIKQYKHYTGRDQIVKAMFMVVRNHGYAYGFAVTAEVELENAKVRAVRTQPLSIDSPSNISAYVSDGKAENFTKYELIKEKGQISKGEFDSVKNKFN
uniref:Uncharacterized protein n=1 Tax=viral metagenome TaxID=1070528 RepID=A0A6C0JVN4_9ZZZZ